MSERIYKINSVVAEWAKMQKTGWELIIWYVAKERDFDLHGKQTSLIPIQDFDRYVMRRTDQKNITRARDKIQKAIDLGFLKVDKNNPTCYYIKGWRYLTEYVLDEFHRMFGENRESFSALGMDPMRNRLQSCIEFQGPLRRLVDITDANKTYTKFYGFMCVAGARLGRSVDNIAKVAGVVRCTLQRQNANNDDLIKTPKGFSVDFSRVISNLPPSTTTEKVAAAVEVAEMVALKRAKEAGESIGGRGGTFRARAVGDGKVLTVAQVPNHYDVPIRIRPDRRAIHYYFKTYVRGHADYPALASTQSKASGLPKWNFQKHSVLGSNHAPKFLIRRAEKILEFGQDILLGMTGGDGILDVSRLYWETWKLQSLWLQPFVHRTSSYSAGFVGS